MTRGAMTGLAVAAGLAVAGAAFADAIAVAQGETQSVSASATLTSMEVHGTLNVRGTSATDVTELAFDPRATTVPLGTAAGDSAVIEIGDYGRISGGLFMIGGPGGAGGIVVGGAAAGAPQWNGVNAHLAIGQITLAPDATSASGVIDILTLNAGAAAGCVQGVGSRPGIVNRSTSADARVLFNGGTFYLFNGFANFPFTASYDSRYPDVVRQGEGGKAIILEGVDGNPVRITYINGQNLYPTVGAVRFRGRGDVILHSTDNTYRACWFWNHPASAWEQNGDLVLTGSMGMRMQGANGLPGAATNGNVRLQGNQHCTLDLNGYAQAVNGLVVSGQAMLTNSGAASVALTFGATRPDGVLSVGKVGCSGTIVAVKRGAGTLTVTNTPYFPAMRVEAGTALFKDDDCTLGALEAWGAGRVVVDGCTLTVNALANDGAAFSCVNGGQLRVELAADTDGKVAAPDGTAAIVKRGTGTTTLHQEAALDADVHVAEGTLAFARPGTTNHWLRFSFTQMYRGNFDLSEMELMNAAGSRVDGGGAVVRIASGVGAGTDGSRVANAAADCAPQDMAPQSIWASDPGWLLNEPAGGYRDRSPSAIFDGQSWTRLRYSTAPSAASPKVFVVRLPAATAEVYQYNFRVGYSGITHPSAWKVETSPDGVSWTEADAHSDVTPPTGTKAHYNGDVHYRLLCGRDGAAGLAAGANVRVDRGATLDCSRVAGGQTLSRLTVDCAAGTGDGTLVNVAFAAAGEVRLVNFPAGTPLENYALPLVFTDAAAAANVHAWRLYVNGAATAKRLAYRDGRLTCLPDGTFLVFR